ncbi:hypothetical protein ACJJTC_009149 [Scirpophaga incertulas]
MYTLLYIFSILLISVNLSEVSYYEILGLSKQASTQEIKQAYKKLAIKLHPDKSTEKDNQEKFMKITEAYETLKDPERRRQYDLYGSYQSYTRKYDYHSQTEYNNLFYNGLYHNDLFVNTLSGKTFYNYLSEGFHFINFYSPFCPPCQNLVEHWKKLAEKYEGIVKIGAVNCKYHNSFCFNSMRIGSYPSLLFYPNGKYGNFVTYRGERTLEHLDNFLLAYLNSRVHIPIVTQIRSTDKPIAYVMGINRIESSSLTRIAYHLNGLVNVCIIENDDLRSKLTNNEYAVIVFKYKDISKEIENTEEKGILKEIVEVLPKIDRIDPTNLKDIRNGLRDASINPVILYFSTKNHDKLLLHQMRVAFPDYRFGEIDCDKWSELCSSLHVEQAPAWGALKEGGAYQRAYKSTDIRDFIQNAVKATNLHTLSASDFNRILEGDAGTWVLVVVPYGLSYEHIVEPITKTSLHFLNSENIQFGIMACSLNTDKHCRQIANEQPTIVIQERRKRHYYNGHIEEHHLIEYIQLLIDSEDLYLDEQKILEIMDASSRQHSWLVAYLPKNCGQLCDDLAHEWRLVAKKLRPLEFVRLGMLQCSAAQGICINVRGPTARLYPLASGMHYTINLQHLTQAPYIWEWALDHIDDSVQKLNWQSFTQLVAVEEINPSSDKKPWLVYFHSPRCYHCYEHFADFAITGIYLHGAVQLGKVNCLSERRLCQQERIMSYPSLKLYLGRNKQQAFSTVIPLELSNYSSMLEHIKPYLREYDERLLNRIDKFDVTHQGFVSKHDEF